MAEDDPSETRTRTVSMVTPWDGAHYQLSGAATDESVILRIVREHGHYEPDVMIHLQRTVQDGWTVLDVGANVGALTVVLSRLAGSGQVLAFEPSAENYTHLVGNVRANECANVTTYQLALGRESGTASLDYEESFAGGAHVVAGTADGSNTIVVRALDDFVDEMGLTRIDLVKVDVEGAEEDVVAGAIKTLRKHQPDLVIELNPVTHLRFRGTEIDPLWKTLRTLYRWIFWIREDGTNALITSDGHLRKVLLRKGFVDLYCTTSRRPALVGTTTVMAIRAARERYRLAKKFNRFVRPDLNFVVAPGASLSIVASPQHAQAGEGVSLELLVRNGSPAWLDSTMRSHPVTIGIRWTGPDGHVSEIAERVLLPKPIRPGATARLPMTIAAPSSPGSYELLVSLVQEHFAWLNELFPDAGATASIDVR